MNRKDTTERKKYINSIRKRCRSLPHGRQLCRDINAEVENYIKEGGDSAHLAERFGSPDTMADALKEEYDPEAYRACKTKQRTRYAWRAAACILLIATLYGGIFTYDKYMAGADTQTYTNVHVYPE